MDIVKLKNGSEEPAPLVKVTMHSLASLLRERPIHLYELAQVARQPEHEPFGQTGGDLADLSLLTAGPDLKWHMHDSIRNIVLSAIEGEGFELRLVDPAA